MIEQVGAGQDAKPAGACRFCAACYQIALNVLLALDRLANALAGGDPAETISQRVARAERAGHRWARAACRLLDVFSAKHCRWSLAPGSIGREVWSWSKDGPPNPPAPPQDR